MRSRFAAGLVACATAASALGALPAHATDVLPGSAGAARPIVAVDPYGTAYVAATDASGSSLLWKIGDSASVLAPGGVLAQLPGGAAASLAIDTAADVHLAQTSRFLTVRRSIDAGATWDRGTPLASVRAGTPSVSMAASKFNSIVEGATLVLVTAVAGNLVATRSDDGGLTFGRASVVDPACKRKCELGNVVVDETGNDVAVAYLRNGGLELARSSDGGLTFAVTDVSGEATGAPSLARAHDGTLLLTWCGAHAVALARISGSSPAAAVLFDASEPSDARIAADSSTGIAIVFDDAGGVALLKSSDGETFARSSIGTESRAELAIAADPQGGFVAVVGAPGGITALRIPS